MSDFRMMAKDSVDGSLYYWNGGATPDFAGTLYPGPNSPEDVAVVGQNFVLSTTGGVDTFNGRNGNVVPLASDYDADQVDYDNATSGLTATDAQAALDELAAREADGVVYDNTTSGLTATDVQGAIDEVEATVSAETTSLIATWDGSTAVTSGDYFPFTVVRKTSDFTTTADTITIPTAGLYQVDIYLLARETATGGMLLLTATVNHADGSSDVLGYRAETGTASPGVMRLSGVFKFAASAILAVESSGFYTTEATAGQITVAKVGNV